MVRLERGDSGIAKFVIVALMIAVLGAVGTGIANAVLNNDPFELDGNVAASAGQDWGTFFTGGVPGGLSGAPTYPTAKVFVTDAPSNADDTFTTGGSKDIHDVSSWLWTTGTAQDKADILHAFAVAYSKPCTADPAQTCQYLYFGADRYAQAGDTSLGFWFFHNSVGKVGTTSGTFSGGHTAGDVLVLTDFTNGGSQPTVKAYQWDINCTGADSNSPTPGQCAGNNLRVIATGADCATLTNANVCGEVNSAPITSPWSYQAKGNNQPADQIPAGGFFEGGLNVTALVPNFDACLSSFLAETRASQEVSSTLSDFALGNFQTCGVNLQISQTTDTNAVGQTHTVSAHANWNTGSGFVNYPNATITFTLTGASAGTLTCVTDASGNCSTTFVSSSVGTTTINASVSALISTKTFTATTNGVAPNSGSLTKKWVDANISITPPNDVNHIGEAHTFNVTVNALPGAAGAPTFNSVTVSIPGATVTNDGCISPTVSGNTATCSVTIAGSSTPGTVYTATATALVTMGGVQVSRTTDGTGLNSAAATKAYNCLTHAFTMNLTGAGKSTPTHTALQSGTWTVTFYYRYATYNGTTYSSWSPEASAAGVLLNPTGGVSQLNFAATVSIPTPDPAYSAKVEWRYEIKQGSIVIYTSGTRPLIGELVLANSGNCAGSDSSVSPVSSVTVIKGLGTPGDLGFDVGLQGWAITATSSAGTVQVTTGADGSGNMNLDGLVAWTICETQQAGWTQSYPPASNSGLGTDANSCYLRPQNAPNGTAYLFGNRKHLGLSTLIHDASHQTVLTVQGGTIVHDTATSSGALQNVAPTGAITFKFFTTLNCTGDFTSPATTSESGYSAATVPTAALAAGSYSYLATIADDANYVGTTADCEPLTVQKADLTLTTTLYAGQTEIPLGGEAPAGSLPTVHDTATVGAIVGTFAPSSNVAFTFYATNNCTGTATAAGTAAVVGTLANGSTPQGPLTAGSYSFRASYPGDSNYNSVASDCEPFTVTTITITKLVNGGNGTFTFSVGGPSPSTPSITTAGEPGLGQIVFTVLAGSYTVSEDPTQGFNLVGLVCGTGDVTLGTASFTAAAGTNTTCAAENTAPLATRTQGFWQTHTLFTNLVWTTLVPDQYKSIATWGASCAGTANTGTIDASSTAGANEVMGGFWSNIANENDGDKRSTLNRNRMQLLQQLLAAILNRHGLGTDDGGKIATAITAYCSGNGIQGSINALSKWNASGDDVAITNPYQAASPRLSRQQANYVFWDQPY